MQIEVDAILREAEERKNKRSSDEQQLHDAMLSAIFKSVSEDTVPDSAVGIYFSGKKGRTGCDIPKVIDFRSLPIGVQDDLMKAEMWPRYRISGYERMFHYRLTTVITRKMVYKATCHSLSPGAANNMYPPAEDQKHRDWINELMHFRWAIGCSGSVDPRRFRVRRQHPPGSRFLSHRNAYQLDLFLFKDMGIGGILFMKKSIFPSRKMDEKGP